MSEIPSSFGYRVKTECPSMGDLRSGPMTLWSQLSVDARVNRCQAHNNSAQCSTILHALPLSCLAWAISSKTDNKYTFTA